MVRDAEKYANEDKKRKVGVSVHIVLNRTFQKIGFLMVSTDSCFVLQDMIETINNAESVVHDIESKMDEFKDQLPENEVSFDQSSTAIMML